MWVAKFKLKDDDDVYNHLAVKYKVEIRAVPYTHYVKNNKINVLAGGTLSGSKENKKKFISSLKKSKKIKLVEQYKDYFFAHAVHPLSREAKAEIKIFYNPQYIRVKPVHVDLNGWEHWEVACLDRDELNKLVRAAKKYYHGELLSIKKEKIKSVVNMELAYNLTDKQEESLRLAYNEGYYEYPRQITLPELAGKLKRSYSTFQENLRKAENKILNYLLKYR